MSETLKQPQVNRQKFDPTNEEHLASLTHFIRTGNWGDIQFFAETPYNEVPMTVLMRYCEHGLKTSRETTIERSTRLSAQPNLLRMPAPLNPDEDRAATMAIHKANNALYIEQTKDQVAKT